MLTGNLVDYSSSESDDEAARSTLNEDFDASLRRFEEISEANDQSEDVQQETSMSSLNSTLDLELNGKPYKKECFEGCHCFYNEEQNFLCKDDILALLMECPEELMTDRVPEVLPVSRKGSLLFVVREIGRDIGIDFYSPWTSRRHDKRRTSEKYTGFEAFFADKPAYVRIRKCYHSGIPGLKRLIAVKDKLAVVQYVYEIDGITTLGIPRNATASEVNNAKDALDHRTTTEARQYLRKKNQNVKESTLAYAGRLVSTKVKSKRGPRKACDANSLSIMAYNDSTIGFIPYNSNGPQSVSYKIFENAVKVFSSAAPTALAIDNFRSKVEKALISAEQGQENELDDILASADKSQRIPGMESMIMADTTFGISHSYVTLVFGYCPYFLSKFSGKDSLLLLAVSCHTEKTIYAHSILGEALNRTFLKIAPRTRVPAVCTDNETALEALFKGEAFSLAEHTLCDVHLKTNLVRDLGKESGENCFRSLVGTATNDGSVLGGLFFTKSEHEFDEKLKIIELKDAKLGKWLMKRRQFLLRHTLKARLRSGYTGHYNTTNGIEGKNSNLKLHLPGNYPAEEVIAKLTLIHEEEIRQIHDAIFGRDSKFRCSPKLMAMLEQLGNEKLLDHLQLPLELLPSDLVKRIPTFFQALLPKSVIKSAMGLNVRKVDDDFIIKNSDNALFEISLLSGRFQCSCKHKSPSFPCCHILAVLLLPEHDHLWNAHENFYRRVPSKTVMASSIRAHHGTKRKGQQRSAKNYVRHVKHYLKSPSPTESEFEDEEDSVSGREQEALSSPEVSPLETPVQSRSGRRLFKKKKFTPGK